MPMAYASRAHLELRIGVDELRQLTDRDTSSGDIVTEVLDAAQADATGEIDAALSEAGYDLPLGSVPQRLVAAEVALTRWNLYKDQRPAAVEQDAELARAWLSALVSGETSLRTRPAMSSGSQARIMTRPKLGGLL